MPINKREGPASAGPEFSRLLGDEGAIKRLSARSGLAPPTLRQILQTGHAKSCVTALMLERATEGIVKADDLIGPHTKGSEFYAREPARSLLIRALDDGLTLAKLLAKHGLTTSDLWKSMNSPPSAIKQTRDCVAQALRQLQIPYQQDASHVNLKFAT